MEDIDNIIDNMIMVDEEDSDNEDDVKEVNIVKGEQQQDQDDSPVKTKPIQKEKKPRSKKQQEAWDRCVEKRRIATAQRRAERDKIEEEKKIKR